MPFGDYDSSNNSMDLLGMQANKDMYEDMGTNSKNSDREFKKSKTKKKVDVKKIVIVVIIVAACLAAFFARKVYTRNYYTQDLEQHFLDLPRQMNAEMSMSANLPI